MGMGLFIGNWAWNVKPSLYRLMIPSFYITGTSSYILGNIEHKKKNKMGNRVGQIIIYEASLQNGVKRRIIGDY